jgi:integrase/recombinase XerD
MLSYIEAKTYKERTMPLSRALRDSFDRFTGQHKYKQRPRTQRTYASALSQFARWADQQATVIEATTLDLAVFVSYTETIAARAKLHPGHPRYLRTSTAHHYVNVLTAWLAYEQHRGRVDRLAGDDGELLDADAVRDVLRSYLRQRRKPRAPRMPNLQRLPAYYDDQLRRFIAQHGVPEASSKLTVPVRTYLNMLRNRALVYTLFSTGGRVSAILSLHVTDVRERLGGIRYSTTVIEKGAVEHVIRLDNAARETISAYLQARQRIAALSQEQFLFISHGPHRSHNGDHRLTQVTAWRVVQEAAHALADEREREGAPADEIRAIRATSPHSFRHFMAQAMLDEGAQYDDVSHTLGHSSVKVTEDFYARPADERILEVADQFAPRPARIFRQHKARGRGEQ